MARAGVDDACGANATHRIDPQLVEEVTHELIEWIDKRVLSEPEKLAVLLAAGYTQEQFMREATEQRQTFEGDVERVKQFHQETIEELARGR